MSDKEHKCDGKPRVWSVALYRGEAMNGKPLEVVKKFEQLGCCSDGVHSGLAELIAIANSLGEEIITGACYRKHRELTEDELEQFIVPEGPKFPKIQL